MRGMDAATGRPLDGAAHLRQSIRDVLTTPIGSRVMRRDYGSRLFDLVDHPVTAAFGTALVAATAEALDRWEPRYRLTRVRLATSAAGRVTLDLDGVHVPDGTPLRVAGITV